MFDMTKIYCKSCKAMLRGSVFWLGDIIRVTTEEQECKICGGNVFVSTATTISKG